MSTEYCRFGLNVNRSTRSAGPTAHIFLQRVVRHPNGMLAITPVCGSLAEIEGEIEVLRSELENVLRQARQAFSPKPPPAVTS
jgi:hypothetical protein